MKYITVYDNYMVVIGKMCKRLGVVFFSSVFHNSACLCPDPTATPLMSTMFVCVCDWMFVYVYSTNRMFALKYECSACVNKTRCVSTV